MENFSNSSEDMLFTLLMILLLGQILVGIVQLIGASIRTGICLYNKKTLGPLKIYWIMVLAYAGVFTAIFIFERFFTWNVDYMSNSYYELTKWMFIVKVLWVFAAWIIAVWYLITVVLKKNWFTKTKFS